MFEFRYDPLPDPERVLSLRDACFLPSERVPAAEAEGRIAARSVAPCPPGVPAVLPGERITAELCGLFRRTGRETVEVLRRT